jgi:hypothetical protein
MVKPPKGGGFKPLLFVKSDIPHLLKIHASKVLLSLPQIKVKTVGNFMDFAPDAIDNFLVLKMATGVGSNFPECLGRTEIYLVIRSLGYKYRCCRIKFTIWGFTAIIKDNRPVHPIHIQKE